MSALLSRWREVLVGVALAVVGWEAAAADLVLAGLFWASRPTI